MKELIVEELAQSIANRFMELYLNAEILGERRIYLEFINDTVEIEDNGSGSLLSWYNFLDDWKTEGSAVSELDQLWRNSLEKNIVWFIAEHYADIGLELIARLAETCVGKIKVTTSPTSVCITVQK